MKKSLFTISVLASIFTAKAQENDGYILSALHNEESFLKSDGLIMNRDKAEKEKITLIFKNAQLREYAVSVLHDANDNLKIDFEVNGMPIKNYALSNNPMLMGPPRFEEVKFIVGHEDLALNIRF
ncbi:DUF2141 domain-containing protein [Maribacter arcticus]|uniref:DUF2141 domain-containing protein n=1 Tax=Maribacter arcticus TaxID=561365 RepID=UPI003001FAF5